MLTQKRPISQTCWLKEVLRVINGAIFFAWTISWISLCSLAATFVQLKRQPSCRREFKRGRRKENLRWPSRSQFVFKKPEQRANLFLWSGCFSPRIRSWIDDPCKDVAGNCSKTEPKPSNVFSSVQRRQTVSKESRETASSSWDPTWNDSVTVPSLTIHRLWLRWESIQESPSQVEPFGERWDVWFADYVDNDEICSSTWPRKATTFDRVQQHKLEGAQDVVRYHLQTDRGKLTRNFDFFNPRPMDTIHEIIHLPGYMWSGVRLSKKIPQVPDLIICGLKFGLACRKQLRRRKIENGLLLKKSIIPANWETFFIDPEDGQQKEIISKTPGKLKIPTEVAMPWKMGTKQPSNKLQETARGKRLGSTPRSGHEDHIAGERGAIRQVIRTWCTSFIPMLQAMNIADATSAVDKGWEKLEQLPTWQLSKVKSIKKIVLDAQREKKKSTLPHWWTSVISKMRS